ncbi:MAG: deoxyhypusine synthase family protein [Thermoplasmata archaeon]|nr:deoxyhypusine synthase family protein [Thermoplasmata archaeon]
MHQREKIKDLEMNERRTVAQLVQDFGGMSYNARKLATASDIWVEALENDARIYFSLAGAMTPAGLRLVIAAAMERGLIDILVTTGANMVHDALQALYGAHEQGSELVDDDELKANKVMRIFDTFLSNEYWEKIDKWLEQEFYPSYVPGEGPQTVIVKPTEFHRKLGEVMHNNNDKGVLATAYRLNIPVYCPAYTDSDLGISLEGMNEDMERFNKKIIVDPISDFHELVKDVERTPKRAAVMVGGGSPKNYVLQSSISLKQEKDHGFDYGIQLTTDTPIWGGLSGATLREAYSWGKMRTHNNVTVYSDATITLPLLVESVISRFGKRDTVKE